MRLRISSLCLLALVACGGNKDDVSSTREMAVGSCMKKVPPTLGAYFDGRATETETDSVFECIQNSLKLFTERTEGKDAGVYTNEEIRTFVERFVMDGRTLRPEMVNEALTLKAALFGGGTTTLSRSEIDAFRTFLKSLRDVSQLIRSDLPLSLESSSPQSMAKAKQTAELLGRAFSGAKGVYSLESGFRFTREVQKYLNSPSLDYWLSRSSLIQTGLRVLISNPGGQIRPSDWSPIFLTAYQAFQMGRHARIWANEKSGFFDVAGFTAWEQVYESTTDLLAGAIERSPEQVLKLKDLIQWLGELNTSNLASIKPEVFEQFLIFKKSWLGSETTDLSKKDIDACKVWVKRFHESGAKLKPYFPITSESSPESIQAFDNTMQTWANWLAESASPLALSDLKNFLLAIQNQFEVKDFAPILKRFNAYTALFEWAANSKHGTIEPKDWPTLAGLLSKGLRLFNAFSQNDFDLVASRSLELFTWIGKTNQNQKLALNSVQDLWAEQVDPNLMQAFVNLKAPIVGGDSATITPTELKKFTLIARDLRAAALPLQEMKDSQQVIAQLGKLSPILSRFSGTISWSQIATLIKELQKTQPSTFGKKFLARESWYKEIAGVALFPNVDAISPKDWKIAIDSIQLGNTTLNQVQKLNESGQLIYWGQGLNDFEQVVNGVLDWLETKNISVGQIRKIVHGLEPNEVPMGLNRDTLEEFIGPLMSRFLNHVNIDSLPDDQIAAISINRSTVKGLRDELARFVAIQRALPHFFTLIECVQKLRANPSACYFPQIGSKPLVTSDPLTSEYLKVTLLEGLVNDSMMNRLGLSKSHLASFKELVFNANPLFQTTGDQLYFVKNNESLGMNINTLSQTHWQRILSKNIIRGYAKDPARAAAASGITESEMKVFIDEVRPIGLELFVIDPLTQNIHGKRFFEGTHFTSTAKGLSLMNAGEFAEMIAYLKSGSSMGTQPNKVLTSRCPTLQGHGYGFPYIDSECYRRVFYNNVDVFWKRMPNMALFYKNLAETEKKLFRDLMEFCADAYSITVDAKWMTSADTRSYMVLLQYIESLLKRFDTNLNGTIDLEWKTEMSWTPVARIDEVEDVYPIFKSKIADVAKDITNDYILYSAFTYLLSTGEIPVKGTYAFNKWLAERKFASFSTNRLVILKIFSEIQRTLNAKPDDPKPTY